MDRKKEQQLYYLAKVEEDTIYKVRSNLIARIKTELNKKGIKKNFTYSKLFGCSTKVLKKYLEEQFKDGMNWKNYGYGILNDIDSILDSEEKEIPIKWWEVDHIKPFSSFDFSNETQLFECCNYKNLQPLWSEENKKKWAKI